MRLLLTNIFIFLCYLSFGQEVYQLDSIDWVYQKPEGFEYNKNEQNNYLFANNELFSISKNDDLNFGALEAAYSSDQNLKNLTPEVYVYVLKDNFEKSFNTDKFKANVSVATQFIDNRKFYLVRNFVTEADSGMSFYVDFYFIDIAEKELNITIVYNNDEDKIALEQSFFNSKFK